MDNNLIIANTSKPDMAEFVDLMAKVDKFLNADALVRPKYYADRGGTLLEDDVTDALQKCAEDTAFEGTIEKVSGRNFPDIVASHIYGVEVKSTCKDSWKSTGSSILESSRIKDVERIYMTFGKLGGKVEFLSRPYEECLYDIATTHMPRYRIDMETKPEDTIFAKMKVSYDTLSHLDDPIPTVAAYYKQHAKHGERPWWTGDEEEDTVMSSVEIWGNLDHRLRLQYTMRGLYQFKNIFLGEYDDYAVWLATKGVVDGHVRDQFSAGGKVNVQLSDNTIIRVPAIYGRIVNNRDKFKDAVKHCIKHDGNHKNSIVTVDEINDAIAKWIDKVTQQEEWGKHNSIDSNTAYKILTDQLLPHKTATATAKDGNQQPSLASAETEQQSAAIGNDSPADGNNQQ